MNGAGQFRQPNTLPTDKNIFGQMKRWVREWEPTQGSSTCESDVALG